MLMRISVGTMTLETEYVNTETFECAAWHRSVKVPAGTYPVHAYFEWRDGTLRARGCYVAASGVVTSACFVSLFGGVAINGREGYKRGSEEVGKTADTGWHIGVHAPGLTLCAEVKPTSENPYADLVLAEGVRAVLTVAPDSGCAGAEGILVTGELPRAEQIALCAATVARAKVAGYHGRSRMESEARSVGKLVTHDDVRARFESALAKHGVDPWWADRVSAVAK